MFVSSAIMLTLLNEEFNLLASFDTPLPACKERDVLGVLCFYKLDKEKEGQKHRKNPYEIYMYT